MSAPVWCWLLLVVATGVLCACCQPRRSAMSSVQTDLFKLSASPGTVDGYPSTIDEGRFITPGGGSFPVPYGHFLYTIWRD